MAKPRRLGRGLEALLSQGSQESNRNENQAAAAAPSPEVVRPEAEGLTWVGVYDIDRNPFQPRRDFKDEDIRQLSESIIEHGMIQPIVLRRVADRYQLVSGERRWRAATVAGWEKVHAQVWEVDDQRMAELAIVENVQRKDLNAIEKATSFHSYLQKYDCTQEDLAQRLKIDRSTISNFIRLLDLPETVKEAICSGTISQGHGRALLTLGDASQQLEFCKRIQSEGLSVRAVERLVQEGEQVADEVPQLKVVGGEDDSPSKPSTRSDQVAALEQDLRMALGTKVQIQQTGTGKGKIVIHFTNHSEFERLHHDLGGDQVRSDVG